MKTFHVQTLGCKVNHYESEQIATLLLSRGLTATDAASADIRIVNTCSVTMQAASQSRQSVRRLVRLPVLSEAPATSPPAQLLQNPPAKSRLIVTGCWATSNSAEASSMPGVDAVVSHHQNVAEELDRLLKSWETKDSCTRKDNPANSAGRCTGNIEPKQSDTVNGKVGKKEVQSAECKVQNKELATHRPENSPDLNSALCTLHFALPHASRPIGTTSLPLLGQRQRSRQRAFLKIQDGCDAHCTYCIIPTLRPTLWSKPIADVVKEARALVDAGHVEIVLTGIFLGAYGQPTALRRRQLQSTAKPLGALIDSLCQQVTGLRRLRLSSLEPGDLTDDLVAILRSHRQIVPHFHLPLQSGSDVLLRRMNRQYTRDDFLRMVDRVRLAFDRPALTTDVVVGFPGENDEEFQHTIEVVRRSGFIHVHAFPYSPRPGTAAARWTDQYIRGPVVNARIAELQNLAEQQSFAFRKSFLGKTMDVIVERNSESETAAGHPSHGRCERYFPILLDRRDVQPGQSVRATIAEVTPLHTTGRVLG